MQVTVCLDLTDRMGLLAFAINGAYQGVAMELPRPLDGRGRPVPFLPHLLLRNMDVAVDFAGDMSAVSPSSPLFSFHPWQVYVIPDCDPDPLLRPKLRVQPS